MRQRPDLEVLGPRRLSFLGVFAFEPPQEELWASTKLEPRQTKGHVKADPTGPNNESSSCIDDLQTH